MAKKILYCKICAVRITSKNSKKGTFISRHAYKNRCVNCIKIYNDERYRKRDVKAGNKASRKYRYKNWQKILIYHAKRKRHNKPSNKVTISEDWIQKQYRLQKGKCHWTKIDFVLTKNDHALRPSLDRLNVGGPYSKENTVLALKSVNFGRNENSVRELIKFFNKIASNN